VRAFVQETAYGRPWPSLTHGDGDWAVGGASRRPVAYLWFGTRPRSWSEQRFQLTWVELFGKVIDGPCIPVLGRRLLSAALLQKEHDQRGRFLGPDLAHASAQVVGRGSARALAQGRRVGGPTRATGWDIWGAARVYADQDLDRGQIDTPRAPSTGVGRSVLAPPLPHGNWPRTARPPASRPGRGFYAFGALTWAGRTQHCHTSTVRNPRR
jgi:hypothetical protein